MQLINPANKHTLNDLIKYHEDRSNPHKKSIRRGYLDGDTNWLGEEITHSQQDHERFVELLMSFKEGRL